MAIEIREEFLNIYDYQKCKYRRPRGKTRSLVGHKKHRLEYLDGRKLYRLQENTLNERNDELDIDYPYSYEEAMKRKRNVVAFREAYPIEVYHTLLGKRYFTNERLTREEFYVSKQYDLIFAYRYENLGAPIWGAWEDDLEPELSYQLAVRNGYALPEVGHPFKKGENPLGSFDYVPEYGEIQYLDEPDPGELSLEAQAKSAEQITLDTWNIGHDAKGIYEADRHKLCTRVPYRADYYILMKYKHFYDLTDDQIHFNIELWRRFVRLYPYEIRYAVHDKYYLYGEDLTPEESLVFDISTDIMRHSISRPPLIDHRFRYGVPEGLTMDDLNLVPYERKYGIAN